MSETSADPVDGWLDRERQPFAAALTHCRSGAFQEGYAICQQILAQAPNDIDALHLSGLILCQGGAVTAGIERLRRAVSLNGQIPVLHYNIAEALHGSGHLGEAAAHYEVALRLAPGFADAQGALGNCLLRQNHLAEALAALRRAIALDPGNAVTHDNLGSALQAQGETEAAESAFRRAIALDPGHLEAHYNLGNALLARKRHDEALASFDAALRLHPDLASALHNRGAALLELKRYDEALTSFDRALQLAPGDASTLSNRGTALLRLGRHNDALASYDRALAIDANFVDAFYNRGNALFALGRREEAVASFDRALALKPDLAEALYNRGTMLVEVERHEAAAADFARLLHVAPDHPYARGNLLYARLLACDWTSYAELIESIANDVTQGKPAALPFTLFNLAGPAQLQLSCAARHMRAQFPAATQPLWRGERYHHDRIRLAYLSADFRHHAVAYSLAQVLESHDRSRFEAIGLSFAQLPDDAFGRRLKASLEHFGDMCLRSDREVATFLRDREVDIAINLMGYTTSSQPGIFTLRATPIQVNYFGFAGTLGAEYMDYIIGDRIIIPEVEHSAYTEKVVYLPDTYYPTDSTRPIEACPPSRREAGLPETGFVFCSFNNTHKMNPPVFDIWLRLLRQVEGSVLWLLSGTEAADRNRRGYAAEHGIDPARLVFAPRATQEDHLARYPLADLFLDTLPYNAHTTAVDALRAGLPMVTCSGSTFVGRVAASLLNAIGLRELVTTNLEDYEALARRLARDPAALAAINAKLERNRATHPLFDTLRYTRHLESAYETMWQRYQRGEPPVTFAVPSLPPQRASQR